MPYYIPGGSRSQHEHRHASQAGADAITITCHSFRPSRSIALTIDNLELRRAFSAFATGVAIVCARPRDGDAFGITINSLASLSLDPPLLLWNLRTGSRIHEMWQRVDRFSVNVLAAGQDDLCWRFATAERNRMDDDEFSVSAAGVPRLPGCLAWYDCAVEDSHPGGDHVINVGRILAVERRADREPLLVYGGRLHALGDERGDEGS